MDYSIKCPDCSKKHVYFSHEIGSMAECARCGKKFVLPENDLRVARSLAWIGAVTFGFLALFVIWLLLARSGTFVIPVPVR
jgi:DNA-directed RNA polymerase subunit RPC12/RpoP